MIGFVPLWTPPLPLLVKRDNMVTPASPLLIMWPLCITPSPLPRLITLFVNGKHTYILYTFLSAYCVSLPISGYKHHLQFQLSASNNCIFNLSNKFKCIKQQSRSSSTYNLLKINLFTSLLEQSSGKGSLQNKIKTAKWPPPPLCKLVTMWSWELSRMKWPPPLAKSKFKC